MKPFATRTCAAALLAACVSVAATAPAHAGLDVIVPPGAEYLPTFSVPKLPPMPGWRSNLSASLNRQSRVLFPVGATRETATSMIIARALDKSLAKPIRSLDDLIVQDHIQTRGADPAAEINEIPQVTDKAGRKMRVFAERSGDHRVHQVKAYGEEKDAGGKAYWTLFSLTVEGDTKELSAGVNAFQAMLRAYR